MKDPLAKSQRRGGILMLVVILLFVLMAITGLLIDVGMARLTQARMQSVTDAAAIDGGWQMALGSDQTEIRDAVIHRTDELFETWSPKRLEFQGGYDLNNDGIFESSPEIDPDTTGEPLRHSLNQNLNNEPAGDIVLGNYDETLIPNVLPGQPNGYDRTPVFVADADDPDSILVRLRQTEEQAIPGGTSEGNLPYLWSRGSLLDLGLKGQGMAVRSESIANLSPATAVGSANSESIPSVLSVAIPLNEVVSETFNRDSLMTFADSPEIGASVINAPNSTLTGIGYLPIAKQMASGQWQVIGFMFASISVDNVVPSTPVEHGFFSANVTSNLANISNLSDELIEANQSLSGPYIARAASLTRSQQITGVSP
jgi:hypothetical protein